MARNYNDFMDEDRIVERISSEAKAEKAAESSGSKRRKLPVKLSGQDKQMKIIIISLIAIIVIAVIAMIIVFFHFSDTVVYTDNPTISTNNVDNSYHLDDDSDSLYGSSGETTTQTVTIDSLFDGDVALGQVDDTKYTSEFTGLTFQPEDDGWTMVASSTNLSLAAKAIDLAAVDSEGVLTAKLQYFKLGDDGDYKTTDALISALKENAGDNIKTENISKTIGGISFKGFTYEYEKNSVDTVSEVLVGKVEGYAVVISVSGSSQSDCDTVLKLFS